MAIFTAPNPILLEKKVDWELGTDVSLQYLISGSRFGSLTTCLFRRRPIWLLLNPHSELFAPSPESEMVRRTILCRERDCR